jgi:type IV pilus assembly protein PilP
MHWFVVVAAIVAVGVSLQGVRSSEAQETVLQADYRYDAKGRRDPFDSLVKAKPLVPELRRVRIDPDRPQGPLERFDISALKLVGILWGDLGRRALIRAPDDKGYFVTVGMYMGQNGGQVIGVEDDRLILEEKYEDAEGNIVGKTLTLPLRRKEEQKNG